MAGISYIGKPISLISHSDIRYRGILHGIDPAASTISLANVISMGTENRRPSDSYIPPSDVPYEFIIFRASEVKDIAVDHVAEQSPPPQRSVHDDPAVMTASASQPGQVSQAPAAPQPTGQPQAPGQNAYQYPVPPAPGVGTASSPSNAKPTQHRTNSVDTANTGLENVQRAMGELRVSNGDGGADTRGQSGPRRGRGSIRAGDISIPTAEFDFASSNARFDKTSLGASQENSEDDITNPSDDESKDKPKEVPSPGDKAYNPKASFFDSLSSGARQVQIEKEQVPRQAGRGTRGRRGSSRREEERQRNVATFGEPGGGPGLLGPGAYVPGWGGAGRRGQGRGGRRGGPRPS